MNTSYNGWTNYETWCVNLWLSNDEGSYEMVNEVAAQAYKDAARDKYQAAINLADALKDTLDEFAPEMPANMYSDLLHHALGMADYYEIAKSWIDDMEFDEEDEEDEDEEDDDDDE